MKVNVSLTFNGNCAAAFDLYKRVFGGDFTWRATFGESPLKDQTPVNEHHRIMHVSLPLGDHMQLLGCDSSSLLHSSKQMSLIKQGTTTTNQHICLVPDTRDEADRLFGALSDGGSTDHPLELMFWGSYYGSLTDRFGVQWMMDCPVCGSDSTDTTADTEK